MAAQEGATRVARYSNSLRAALAAGSMLAGAASALAQQQAAAPFRVGMVVASGDVPAVEGLSDIRAAFSRTLGTPVEVVAARDYEALVAAHIAGRVDYAIYSSQAYAAAMIRCECVVPLAFPVAQDGSVGVRSVLIAKPGATPRTIALGAGDSLTGRMAPLALWPDAAEAEKAGRLVFTQSAEDAEAMFLEGTVDGFFGWVPAASDAVEETFGGTPARLDAAGVDAAQYDIVWQSDILRHGPHAVRDDVDPAMREKLVRMLTGHAAGSNGFQATIDRQYGGGFAAASKTDYQPVLDALSLLKAQ